ncbi:unnamed protein product [Effrenium voratum]|nr:unnamed protein product [Effrenium voratum]CAJ1415753.1 unnamed protein product [Effrenium voratum]
MTSSPFGGSLAAMKVKNRLQSIHQDIKKKTAPSSAGPVDLSVTNAQPEDKEKAKEPEPQAPHMTSLAALVSAARTTLPKFGANVAEEEAEIRELLGEMDHDFADLVTEVQRLLRWLFTDADTDFDDLISQPQLKAIFNRAPAPLGSSLGHEVDVSTAAADRNMQCDRTRFIELFILIAVRVNQSPILTSRLADAKMQLGIRGPKMVQPSNSFERNPESRVSMLAGIPRYGSDENLPGELSKWQAAKSAVSAVQRMSVSTRRMSAESAGDELGKPILPVVQRMSISARRMSAEASGDTTAKPAVPAQPTNSSTRRQSAEAQAPDGSPLAKLEKLFANYRRPSHA